VTTSAKFPHATIRHVELHHRFELLGDHCLSGICPRARRREGAPPSKYSSRVTRPKIDRIERNGDLCVAHADGHVVWTTELPVAVGGSPFREDLLWSAASVVAIGRGDAVHFLAADSGAVVKVVRLENDQFGHFGAGDAEVLYVLGWRYVVAVDATLAVRWTSEAIAIDGITWEGQDGARLLLSAEMDPPGGWQRVVLDASNGRELTRGET
jgi:hypothetical protein